MKRNFSKIFRAIGKTLPFLLVGVIVLIVSLYPKKQEEAPVPVVVNVWHIETFEGGKGSRASFLKNVAARVEKKDNTLYYMVKSYTAEGAREALKEGKLPDMISYGIGFGDCLERALPLSYRFSGGEAGGACLAYPWASGRYSLFSLENNFEKEGETVISEGGQNLVRAAAYFENIRGEALPSTSAYVNFLNGKYRYLLGTQRDECRFQTRGVTVYRKDLNEFCDLYQYISVLSAEKFEVCRTFIDCLLSREVQESLEQIGMFSVQKSTALKTVSVFSSEEARENFMKEIKENGDRKKIDKYLKSI